MSDSTPKKNDQGNGLVVSRQERKRQIEEEKQRRRDRVRNTNAEPEAEYYSADPQPAIDDDSPKLVAAYTRVSTSSLDQVSSIENQTKYYTEKIGKTPNWTMYQIYSDEGKSGTSMRKREAFRQMIQDAAAKKFDLIICASVSRFARNIADSIEQVQMLRTQNPEHPVGVFFETEQLYTLDSDSDDRFMIHSMLADWESRNKSRRMILSYDQRIAMGQYPVADLLGYRHTRDGQLIVQEDEARTVRYIYLARAIGTPFSEIARTLTDKARPTLTGRTDWNASMAAGILKNERRWGDLEVRKTVVIDYKKGIIVKNTTIRNGVTHHQRNGAKVRRHHEAIVSPELAQIAGETRPSRRGLAGGGIADLYVLPSGALKGFVSVSPLDCHITHEIIMDICRSVYSRDELRAVGIMASIQAGESHTNLVTMGFQDEYVPRSCYFIDRTTATMTLTAGGIRLNKKALDRLGQDSYVQIIYHPLLKILALRTACINDENAFPLTGEGGKSSLYIPAPDLCQAIYAGMDWIKEYGFRFRAVSRQRGNNHIIFIYLDEPQVLPDKATRERLESEEGWEAAKYIPYHNYEVDPLVQEEDSGSARQIGWIPIATREQRNAMLTALSDDDLSNQGEFAQNPVLSDLPTKKEIMAEIDQILMSM